MEGETVGCRRLRRVVRDPVHYDDVDPRRDMMTFTEFSDLIKDSDSSWQEKVEFMKIRLEEVKAQGDIITYVAAAMDAQLLINWIGDHLTDVDLKESEKLDLLSFTMDLIKELGDLDEDDFTPEQKKELVDVSIETTDRLIGLETNKDHVIKMVNKAIHGIQQICEDDSVGLTEDDIDRLMEKTASFRKEIMRLQDISNGAQSNMDQYFMRDYEGLKKEVFKKW